MAYFHLGGKLNGLDWASTGNLNLLGALLILTTPFNNRDTVSFGGKRLLEQA
jgi:hypothetical protein